MCAASRNATSSLASGAGPTPSSSPDGETDLFGQAVARVSHSRRQANGKPKMTRSICGRIGFGSFASAALSESLASRLQAHLDSGGGTLWRQTWKRKRTPLGRLFWAHTVSARRTSGNDFGGWPTPTANDAKGSAYAYSGGDHRKPVLKLTGAARLWPTPTARDSRTLKGARDRPNRTGGHSLAHIILTALAEARGRLNPCGSRG